MKNLILVILTLAISTSAMAEQYFRLLYQNVSRIEYTLVQTFESYSACHDYKMIPHRTVEKSTGVVRFSPELTYGDNCIHLSSPATFQVRSPSYTVKAVNQSLDTTLAVPDDVEVNVEVFAPVSER